jgi:hypothetical protein
VSSHPFFFSDCAVLLWSSDDPDMVVEMTKFYMRWHLNPMLIPTNPEERMKLWMSMLELVKADIKSGTMSDWGMCSDASGGYAFAETDEKTLHTTITRWMPYVIFDIKPVLSVDQIIESLKRAAAGAKK